MDKYLDKQNKVDYVKQHFVSHCPTKPYDLIYMVMHSEALIQGCYIYDTIRNSLQHSEWYLYLKDWEIWKN